MYMQKFNSFPGCFMTESEIAWPSPFIEIKNLNCYYYIMYGVRILFLFEKKNKNKKKYFLKVKWVKN